ncbi:MAG: cyclopropane-fatty-acyl-phospholipid synthase family protein [Planctomycetota bacterium]
MNTVYQLVDRGLVPLPLLRFGVRRLLAQRLKSAATAPNAGADAWLSEMDASPIAKVPEKANEQHYEVPAAFFTRALGPHLKYSSCFFDRGDEDLATAEARMLQLTSERAELRDGQRVLELGCGWGSLTLWMAEHYPSSRIVGVSNSASQREFILGRAKERGLDNVEIVTADMNAFDALDALGTDERFDRIVSVEMFEHMRNWRALLGRARTWLAGDGRMFVHVFSHRTLNYPFEVADATDWMSEHFFSGGMMPSDDLLPHLAGDPDFPFDVDEHFVVSGRHYSRTAKLWRENIEQRRDEVLSVLRDTYGADAGTWFQRWRVFFLACEELFGYREGSEWVVSHYRLAPTTATAGAGLHREAATPAMN